MIQMIACWCQDKSFKIKHEFHDSPHPIESENLSACYRLLLTLKMELERERESGVPSCVKYDTGVL